MTGFDRTILRTANQSCISTEGNLQAMAIDITFPITSSLPGHTFNLADKLP